MTNAMARARKIDMTTNRKDLSRLAKALGSLREIHLLKERSKARIAVQALEERIGLHRGQTTISWARFAIISSRACRDDQRAFVNLVPYLPIPDIDIAATQLALSEPYFDAGGPQCF
jgi:hypothetical protein